MRNDLLVSDLPFTGHIEKGDTGLVMTSFIAVDDNTPGFRCGRTNLKRLLSCGSNCCHRCEDCEESEDALRRYSKPEVHERAKLMVNICFTINISPLNSLSDLCAHN